MLTVAPGKPVCACRAQGSSSRAAQIRVSSEGHQGAVLGALLNPTCSLVQLLWTGRQSWPRTLPSLGVSSVGWRGPRGLSAGPQEDRPCSSFSGFPQRMQSWPGGVGCGGSRNFPSVPEWPWANNSTSQTGEQCTTVGSAPRAVGAGAAPGKGLSRILAGAPGATVPSLGHQLG